MAQIKVAVIHEWLIDYSGSERVLEQILLLFPEAKLFSVIDFLPDESRSFLLNKPSQTTFIQQLPFAQKYYSYYLPLMPIAIEQLDLAEFDLIISSSHAVAKGVITAPHQLHISYVHSPMRYIWDLQHQYLRESNLDRGIKSLFTRWIFHQLRNWDVRSAFGVDHFIANSKFISQRIQKTYRREAEVIYPPVNVADFPLSKVPKKDFYLVVSRLVPYKKIDLIMAAFEQLPDRKLVVIGDGVGRQKIQKYIGQNIEYLGFQPPNQVKEYMQKARAVVFAAIEDFGITPLEALSCGTPVIGLNKGGLKETIVAGTGILFSEQTTDSLIAGIKQFEKTEFNPQNCHDHAQQFAPDRFRTELKTTIERLWTSHCKH